MSSISPEDIEQELKVYHKIEAKALLTREKTIDEAWIVCHKASTRKGEL